MFLQDDDSDHTLPTVFKLHAHVVVLKGAYELPFIPGKTGHSILQKPHLLNVQKRFSHLFYGSWIEVGDGVGANIGFAQLGCRFNIHYFVTLNTRERESKRSLGNNT